MEDKNEIMDILDVWLFRFCMLFVCAVIVACVVFANMTWLNWFSFGFGGWILCAASWLAGLIALCAVVFFTFSFQE